MYCVQAAGKHVVCSWEGTAARCRNLGQPVLEVGVASFAAGLSRIVMQFA